MSEVIVSKFGSAACSTPEMIRRAAQIVMSNENRKYIVVSAPGSRSRDEVKMTDTLFILNSRYENREDFAAMMEQVRSRFIEIVRGLGVNFDVDAEISNLKKNLFFGKGNDFVVSRGEYIMAKIFAEYLGWKFIDAASFVIFNRDGTLDREKTFAEAEKVFNGVENAVIPGFYG